MLVSLNKTIADLFGIREQDIVPNESHRSYTVIFTSIGIVLLFAFAILNSNTPDNPQLNALGKIEFFLLGLMYFPTLLVALYSRRSVLVDYLLIASIFITLAIHNIYSGHGGDNPYWSFVFPYLVFFLRGQKVGWIVGITFAIFSPTLMYLSSTRNWGLWIYDSEQILFYGIAYFFNVFGAANFNLLRSTFQVKLWEQVEFNTREARRHLKTLERNAILDESTGLFDRQGIVKALDEAIGKLNNKNKTVHIVCIRFFRIQELASIVDMHKVDESIVHLIKLLQQNLPMQIAIGRIEIDKFILILQHIPAHFDICAILESIRQIKNALHGDSFSVHEEYAFGIVEHHAEVTLAGENLVRKAEQALLYADENNQHFQFYDDALNDYFVKRNNSYNKIHTALFNDKLELHYQPQIDLKTGKTIGAEALARWHDDQEGMVPPAQFIPIIESTGLLEKFSLWTVETAIKDCAKWQKYLPNVTVSINLSAEALHNDEVILLIKNALFRWQLNPALVIIELTESVLLKSPNEAMIKVNQIINLGVQLSIDDYGAGFSSLSYLKQLPANEMKIDMQFVINLARDPKDLAIVTSSIDLGQDLGLKVLAEGIEDADALLLLKQNGCDLGQGWFFSKALPLTEFIEWSQKNG